MTEWSMAFSFFSLAKYDQNYDIRDRVRFLRHLVFPDNDQAKLSKYAKKIFLAQKPAPVIESVYKGIEVFFSTCLCLNISIIV